MFKEIIREDLFWLMIPVVENKLLDFVYGVGRNEGKNVCALSQNKFFGFARTGQYQLR